MNIRNRKLYLTIRTLLGLIFILSGAAGLMMGNSTQGVPPAMVPIMQALWASGILQMIKTTELISGLMLVAGFYPALASIFLAPVCIGVIIVNARLMPGFVIAGVIISVLNIYLGYAQWDKYKAIFNK